MTYERRSCFCYAGLNEDKVAFKNSTICDIVIDGVCEVHKSITRDAVESNIKNWLRPCPRYAFKNNKDGKINGEDELRQATGGNIRLQDCRTSQVELRSIADTGALDVTTSPWGLNNRDISLPR
ncbi:hypothetical protein OUZ56_025995 [Daphnia magna]|uniref:Uncharacterized protein n=1 Tax=Daphnia magna TaxID=35525 RepID=A0ABQ9ZKI8_9CRUS|nr:hypothetical protein OUZ56_025995 [Daphnia magna]